MIVYRVSPSGREVVAEVLKRSERGELYVKGDDGVTRWVPADWVIEED